MATVWMRSKLQKMKPKTEQRFAVRTLAEHGSGRDAGLKPVRMPDPPKDRTPVEFHPAMVRKVEAQPPKEPVRRMGGNFKPVRSLLTRDVYVTESRLIKAR